MDINEMDLKERMIEHEEPLVDATSKKCMLIRTTYMVLMSFVLMVVFLSATYRVKRSKLICIVLVILDAVVMVGNAIMRCIICLGWNISQRCHDHYYLSSMVMSAFMGELVCLAIILG